MKSKIIGCILLLAAGGTCQGQNESLADIYRQALLNDPDYRKAEVEFNIGKSSNYKAWANFLPKLNIDPNGDYNRSTDADLERTQDGVEEPLVPGSSRVDKSANLGRLTLNLGIDEWFTFKNRLKDDELSKLTFANAQQSLIVKVTERYFAVLKAQAQLKISQKSLEQKRLELELAETRLDEGLNTITDIYTAKTSYLEAQIDAEQKMVTLDQAFDALTLLTGKAHYSLSGFGDEIPAPDPAPLDAEKWVRSAVQDSYDMQISKILRDKARNESKKSKYFYVPTVSANMGGSRYFSSPASSSIRQVAVPNPDGSISFIEREVTTPSTRIIREGGNSINVRLSIPLFGDNGLSFIDRREKAMREQIEQENFLKSYRQTEFDVRSSFTSILNQKRRLKLQSQQLEQAQLAYDKTKIEYDNGSKSLLDLTNQQRTLLQSEIGYAEAQYGYIESLIKLKQQAGKLTPEDVFEVDSWLREENKVIATKRNTLSPDTEK